MPKTTKHLKPHQFKPGQTGNPDGGRRHDPIKRALKNITQKSLRRVLKAILKGNLANLEAIAEDPKSSVLEVGVASAAARAVREGDYGIIERLIERIVGKIPDEVNLNSRNLNISAKAKLTKEEAKRYILELESEV